MDPRGAFYVTSNADVPPGARNVITDRMNNKLTRLDEKHDWPVTTEHISSGVPITTVEWEMGDDEYDVEWEIDEFKVNTEWYSLIPIHDWG